MKSKATIIGVVGYKNSGKTTVIERIVQELTKKGYHPATAKHINQRGFSMDTEGRDTWKHSAAGANPVVSVSDIETAILMKEGAKRFSLDRLLSFTSENDVILLEGFSWLVLKNEQVGKILCVRNREEYGDLREKAKGEVVAFCSTKPMEKPILDLKKDSTILVRRTLGYVKRKRKVSKILSLLPGLNCRKCGYSSCEEMAAAIYQGRGKLKDCVPFNQKSKLKTRITISDAEVPLQPFVSEIIRNSLLGMISTLKGASISGEEEVEIKVLSSTSRFE